MAFIYQRVKNPHAELYLRRLISWLKSGNPVLILADQRTGDVPADFFGHPAPSTPLPAFMARTLGAPLIAARLVRTRGAHFDLYLEVVPVARSASRERDVKEATGTLQALFESWIRDMPGQWMWAHRRWHRQGPPLGWLSPSAAQSKTRDPKAARRKSKR